MRFLYLAVAPPLPVINGLRMRYWAMIRALTEEGHTVDLMAPDEPDQPAAWDELRAVCGEVIRAPMRLHRPTQGTNVPGRLKNLPSRLPYTVARFRSAWAAEKIRSCDASGMYDAFIATPYTLVNAPEDMRTPFIVDAHNVEHLHLKRYLQFERNPMRWIYGRLEMAKLREWERRTAARSALILACSETDAEAFRRMSPNSRVAVAPNIVDVREYDPTPGGDPGVLLFMGGMDWFPNRQAVEWFTSRVLPELRRRGCRVRFRIFSPDHPVPPAFRKKREREAEVEFIKGGSAREALAACSVFVVPLLIGSGTRFKILEAGAMGKPVVSTQMGAEGLSFENGREILIADDPLALAESIAELLADDPRRRAIGAAGRARVERDYSFPILRDSVRRALEGFESSRRAG